MFNIDVKETGEEVHIYADLPGLTEHDVDVSVEDDVLTIRAERPRANCRPMERSFRFLSSLRLARLIDTHKISLRFNGDVLTVTLPKHKDC